MKTSVAEYGFEGILFPVDNRKDKVMIVLSGSNGGMKLTRTEAEFYQKHNVPALAVAMFATKGTQPALDRVPIEYIETAIAFLKEQGYQRIGIDGASKGSELALLCASMFDELSCVIARVPSYFVSEGLIPVGKSKKPSGTSCWSYQGKELPFAPYKERNFNIFSMLLREKEMHIIDFNKEKDVTPESIIPVENIKAPVLLLSSVHDTVWPSYESSLLIMEKLDRCGFCYPHKHVAYQFLSHAVMPKNSLFYLLAFKTERKYKKECRAERKELERELLDFTEQVW